MFRSERPLHNLGHGFYEFDDWDLVVRLCLLPGRRRKKQAVVERRQQQFCSELLRAVSH